MIIDFSKNAWSAFDPEQYDLSACTTLCIDQNHLTSLTAIAPFAQLSKLSCYHNHLTHLPKSVIQMHTLQAINFSKNRMTFLPEWLGELTELHTLDVQHNDIKHSLTGGLSASAFSHPWRTSQGIV